MRGKGNTKSYDNKTNRITPAYAGKSTLSPKYLRYLKDHPRLCGEKWKYRIFLRYHKGSPPPMRGKDASWKCLLDCKGITPAYAGKRYIHGRNDLNLQDHPRLCGEKVSVSAVDTTPQGSPPPMRGKGRPCENHRPDHRITPAYAGKSESPS